MKTISVPLNGHFGKRCTTLATLWKVTRRDAEVFGFTDHDEDIPFGDVLYKAKTGFSASEVQTSGKLNVDNLEVESHFDSEAILEADVVAGLWDRARVDVYRVNYRDLSQGVYIQRRGETGVFNYDGRRFRSELRGLMQYLANQIGRIYTAPCDATLGDARCKVDLDGSPALRKAFTVTAVADRQTFTDAALTDPDGWYALGMVEWLTGDNAGTRAEVKASTAAGVVTLQMPMARDIQVGDTGDIVPGCNKTSDHCINKFSNMINFRGFEDIPGIDRMIVSDPR